MNTNQNVSNKIIIFCAPSGAGRTTITKRVMELFPQLSFSISATSRPPRGEEKDGIDYYFISKEDFKKKARLGEFLEWEEFYHGTLYGTLKEEVYRIQSVQAKGVVSLQFLAKPEVRPLPLFDLGKIGKPCWLGLFLMKNVAFLKSLYQ